MSQDRELEHYMQGKSDLSRAYAELPPVELPDHLDAAILAEAHRAVGARPGAKAKRRWAVPLSMAATLFVVVMIGLQWPYLSPDAGMPVHTEERPTVVAAAPAPMAEERGQMRANKQAEAMRAGQADKADVAARRDAPAPAVAGKSENAMPAAPAAPRVQMRERAADDKGMALSKEKKSAGRAEESVSDAYEQRAPAAAGLLAPEPARAARSMAAPLKHEADAARQRPEDWIARIKLLKQQGKLDEARKELAELRKRYPDYVVPEDAEIR